MTKKPFDREAATPQERLKYYVTGAIERGEAKPVIAMDDLNHPDLVAARTFLSGVNKITKGAE